MGTTWEEGLIGGLRVAIQIKRAVPSDKVCAEKPKLLKSLTCCQRKRIFSPSILKSKS
jgi:hypothetical protein